MPEAQAPWITREEFLERQEACRQRVRDSQLDGLIAVGGPFYDRPGNLAYLTGHYPPFPSVNFDGEHRGLGFGIFILPAAGTSVLVLDTTAYREEFITADELRPAKNLPAAARQALDDMGLATGKLAFAGAQVAPWALVQELSGGLSLELVPADEIVLALRRRKSGAEIALLREAAQVAEVGMAAALAEIAPGRSEAQVAARGIAAGMTAGADFVRYLRVLSGPYSGWQHRWPPASERILNEGETVCLDYIGAVRGYQFDILRPAIVGEGDAEARTLLEVTAEATEAAIAACGPGVSIREVVAAADRVLQRASLLDHRARFTGHGIGLETVEAPLVMAESDDTLQVGDVICLEPGVLIRGVAGARYEYEVAVTTGGCEVLARPEGWQ